MKRAHGNVIAGCFASSAFIVALAAGLAAGNPVNTILLRAVVAMVLCYPLGLAVGRLCRWVIDQHEAAESGAEPLTEQDAARPAEQSSDEPVDRDVETLPPRVAREEEDALAVTP